MATYYVTTVEYIATTTTSTGTVEICAMFVRHYVVINVQPQLTQSSDFMQLMCDDSLITTWWCR